MTAHTINTLKIKVFADGADLEDIDQLCALPWISGFTTNPSLMKQAGIQDYAAFAKEAVALVGNKPISFEVFADDIEEMERQANLIASWGPNIYVKIPVTNTKRISTNKIIQSLSNRGVRLNVTAVFTKEQIVDITEHLSEKTPSIISIFSGRIADTGRDPKKIIQFALDTAKNKPGIEVLWASCRELFSIVEADECGCNIITVPRSLLDKVSLLGKDLNLFSLETVKMFYKDALSAGYEIATNQPLADAYQKN